jgi:hypothetical protein
LQVEGARVALPQDRFEVGAVLDAAGGIAALLDVLPSVELPKLFADEGPILSEQLGDFFRRPSTGENRPEHPPAKLLRGGTKARQREALGAHVVEDPLSERRHRTDGRGRVFDRRVFDRRAAAALRGLDRGELALRVVLARA